MSRRFHMERLPRRALTTKAIGALLLFFASAEGLLFSSDWLNRRSFVSLDRRERLFNAKGDESLEKEESSSAPPAFSVIDDLDRDDESKDFSLFSGSKSKAKYIPPDFTIDDDDPLDSVKAKKVYKKYIHPDFTTERDDDDDDLSYEETVKPSRRPIRAKYSTSEKSEMKGTSWMDKNEKFPLQNRIASLEEQKTTPKPPPRRRIEGRSDGPRRPRQTATEESNTSFRQDFRGTRVFVQGITPGTSWQDLKDHFRVAGEVVFASVSVDPQTGEPKGHGIVQFETTEMAQTAIAIMRNHPLNGSQLFVREDVQENTKNAELKSLPKGPTPPTKWKCANEDNVEYMSDAERIAIRSLIKARDDARRRRNFDASDKIREELKEKHGVFIDDRLQMWWTSIDGNKVPQTIHDIKGDGRWGKLSPWRQIPTTPENDACVNAALVEGLLLQRDIARREKDFVTADALLNEARESPDGDLTLRIHDESRTWRVWTEAPPPRLVEQSGMLDGSEPHDVRTAAARQCLEIVEEFAPEKVDEIKMILNKFPGREYAVLKKLKKQFLSR